MRTTTLLLLAPLLLAACTHSSPPLRSEYAATRPAGDPAQYVEHHAPEIPLYTRVPNQMPNPTPEVVNWRDEDELTSPAGAKLHFPVVTNIHNPSLTPFLPPPGKATGAAMIVAPGGGHMFLSINHEGYDVARWFADHGVACFVLKYRLARAPGSTYKIDPDAANDGRRAVRYLRANAARFHIDPDRIGFIGFSAGGEVATALINKPEDPNPAPADDIDRVSDRLDFQALLYPGNSTVAAADPAVKEPPTFLAASADDRADIAGGAVGDTRSGLPIVYLRLKAEKVPVELHLYNAGSHGFGVRPRDIAEAAWPDALLAFLKDRGILDKTHSVPVNFPASRPAR